MDLVIILKNGDKAKGYVKDSDEFEDFMEQVTSGKMVWVKTSKSFIRSEFIAAVIIVEDKEETNNATS